MAVFYIVSEFIDGVTVHKAALLDGTPLEALGEEGYDEICRLLAANESDENAREFRAAIQRELEDGKKVQLQIDEDAATKEMVLKSITTFMSYSSIEMFCSGLEISNANDKGWTPNI